MYVVMNVGKSFCGPSLMVSYGPQLHDIRCFVLTVSNDDFTGIIVCRPRTSSLFIPHDSCAIQ